MKSRRTMSAAVAAMAMLLCGPLGANVLEQVPREALVVIRVNNLEQTSAKAAALANRLGVVQFAPTMADPLGNIREQLGLNQGVRADGQGAMVIMPPEAVEEFDDPFMLLIPITDYQQFLQNFEQQEGDGEILQVRVRQWVMPGYLAQRGQYAALASARELLTIEERGFALPQISAREADALDLAVVVNIPAVREQVLPALEMGRAMALAQIDAQAARDPEAARYQPLMQALINHVIGIVETGFENAEGGVFGFRLNEQGINTTMVAEFQQDSPFGQIIGRMRNSDEELLRGLPEGRYLMYGGSVQDPQATVDLIDQLIGPLRAQIEALEQGQPIVQFIDALRETVAAQTGQTFAMIAPTAMPMQESILQVVSIDRGDAEAMRAAQQRLLQAEEALMQALAGDVEETTTITPNAVTVDGVSLDRFHTTLDLDPQTPEAAQAQQVITMLYGPEGLTGYTGSIDDETTITLLGLRQQALQHYIATAKAGEAPMAARVAAVSQHLPQERASVLYLPLDVMVTTVANYLRAFQLLPAPLQLPPDLPPIGMTVATEGGAIRFDSHVPAQLIESITAAGMQLYMQMMGDMMEFDGGL